MHVMTNKFEQKATMDGQNKKRKRSEGDDEPVGKNQFSFDALASNLQEVKGKIKVIFQTFSDFYGKDNSKMWFQQVQSNYTHYLKDTRQIFKKLAELESERVHLEQQIRMAKKKKEYSTLTLPEITEIVIKLEDKLEQYEVQALDQKERLSCKYVTSFGGWSAVKCKALPSSYALNLQTLEQQQLPDLPTARFSCATVSIGNQVYIAGGKINESVWTTAFETFDFISGKWTCHDGIPEVLTEINGSVHGDNIIVWGKNWKKGNRLLIFMFDTSKREWEVIPSPPCHGGLNGQRVAHSANRLFCQSIEMDQRNNSMIRMRLEVLDIATASPSWSEAGQKVSSLKVLLECTGIDLASSKCYRDKIYIFDNNINGRLFSPTEASRRKKAGMLMGELPPHSTRVVCFSQRTNTYSNFVIDGEFQELLACHDDLIVFPDRDGLRLFVPSKLAVMHTEFYDHDLDILFPSVAIIHQQEIVEGVEENSPCEIHGDLF